MVAAAVLIGRTAHTHVPRLLRMTEARARTAARRSHVRTHFDHKYAASKAGTVIAQHPAAGTEVPDGTTVRLTVSRGPAPVSVLSVKGQTVGDAESSLHHLHLRTAVHLVAAPGTRPGTVVGQDPAGGTVARGTVVNLSVAEAPQWRTVTTFNGRSSGPFQIRGGHWRIVYSMGFQGTCNWVLFCSGPGARVTNASGQYVSGFGLSDGQRQVQNLAAGAGTYDVQIIPGSDTATWSVEIQDYY
jgi:PASTA domain-containing protein